MYRKKMYDYEQLSTQKLKEKRMNGMSEENLFKRKMAFGVSGFYRLQKRAEVWFAPTSERFMVMAMIGKLRGWRRANREFMFLIFVNGSLFFSFLSYGAVAAKNESMTQRRVCLCVVCDSVLVVSLEKGNADTEA